MTTKPTDIDSYLASVPDDARATLTALRNTIKTMVPDGVESLSYGMPGYKYLGRPLVYFGAAKNHCALYGLDTDVAERAGYQTSHKGTIRFPVDAPPPESLVRELLTLRVHAIEAAAQKGKKARTG